MKTKEQKQKERTGLLDFLKAKKAKDGRLSAYGEWLLSHGGEREKVEIVDMRAVLK